MAASETPTTISSEKTVTTSGTEVALATTQRVKTVTIRAKVGNTGNIYVGGVGVATTTNDGLAPGDALTITAKNWLDLADIYIDADTNGEGVDFYALKA